MKVTYESKGDFDNVLKWLKEAPSRNPTAIAEKIASDGLTALRNATPRDTGETASGWQSNVKMDAKGLEISWTNTAHPELNVNLAKLIELGHGTKAGGYVSPRPYIKQAMDSVLITAGDKVAGEMFK